MTPEHALAGVSSALGWSRRPEDPPGRRVAPSSWIRTRPSHCRGPTSRPHGGAGFWPWTAHGTRLRTRAASLGSERLTIPAVGAGFPSWSQRTPSTMGGSVNSTRSRRWGRLSMFLVVERKPPNCSAALRAEPRSSRSTTCCSTGAHTRGRSTRSARPSGRSTAEVESALLLRNPSRVRERRRDGDLLPDELPRDPPADGKDARHAVLVVPPCRGDRQRDSGGREAWNTRWAGPSGNWIRTAFRRKVSHRKLRDGRDGGV